MKIVNPDKHTISSILKELNQEFIFSRNRSLTLEQRFPDLFSEKNFNNLFYLEEENQAASFLAVKPIKIESDSQVFNFFLIGDVSTHPRMRGKNMASALLNYVTDHYLKKGYDAGILWTTKSGFYSRLGWKINDNAVLIKCSTLLKPNPEISTKKITTIKLSDLMTLASQKKVKIHRNPGDYLVKPIPSNSLHTLRTTESIIDNTPEYSVYGLCNNELYFYDYFDVVSYLKYQPLGALYAMHSIDTCYINAPIYDHQSILTDCRKHFRSVEFEIQSNRMFISNSLSPELLEKIYLPFSDRI